jgi:hypothetical protein
MGPKSHSLLEKPVQNPTSADKILILTILKAPQLLEMPLKMLAISPTLARWLMILQLCT